MEQGIVADSAGPELFATRQEEHGIDRKFHNCATKPHVLQNDTIKLNKTFIQIILIFL
jgi:hypothetical protein